jgi:hypothetical protein
MAGLPVLQGVAQISHMVGAGIEGEGRMDWTVRDLVEVDSGKVAGQPVVRGTRVPADVVLIDEQCGRAPEQTRAEHALRACGQLSRAAVEGVKLRFNGDVPHNLKPHFRHQDTNSVAHLSRAGLKNGRRLEVVESGGPAL